MGRIVAIGGGTLEGTKPLNEYALSLTGKDKPKVLFIPTASRDDAKYISVFKENFTELGCEVETLEIIKQKYSDSDIDKHLDWMDMVYVGGGNSVYMMNRWKEHGLDVKLKTVFSNDGAVMTGHGSGCISWFKCGYSNGSYVDHGGTDWQYIWADNMLDFHHTAVCPHYSTDSRWDFDLRLLEKAIPGFGLEDYTAFVQIGDHTEFLGCKENAEAYYLIYLNGEMVKKEITMKYIK